MSLVLYQHDLLADCYKIRLFLALTGTACECRTVAMLPGNGADAPWFRQLSPNGAVPVLVDGDCVVSQPEAILLHLAERDEAGSRFVLTDAAGRSAMFQWLGFAAGDLRAAEEARLQSMFGLPSRFGDAAVVARGAFRQMEDHLIRQKMRGMPFFAGMAASLADIAIFPAVGLAADFGLDMSEFPRLLAWSRLVHHLPGFITMPGIREMV